MSHLQKRTPLFSTVLFYINDDYLGGELQAECVEGSYLFKPEAGDVVVMDGGIRHESKISSNGEKIVAVVQLHRAVISN